MTSRRRLAALLLAAALLGASCGGDDADDQLPDAAATDASDDSADVSDSGTADEAAAPTPDAPDHLADPTQVPGDPIDISGIGPIVDGSADDDFDRCSVFTAEGLSGLLGDLWTFPEGEPPNTGKEGAPSTISCAWSVGEGEDLAFVMVAMGAIEDEFDPRLGDSAASAVTLPDSGIGDELFEIPGSTYGPGLAFTQGDVGVLVHVIWGTPDTESRAVVEREAELRVAGNLSTRLPA